MATLTLAVALLLLAASGDRTPGAAAHATFLESTPAPGARLATAPGRLLLEFTEPLNASLTKASLAEAGGGQVPASVRIRAGRRLVIRPEGRLEQGAYRLVWRTVSTVDGHVREGTVGFGVGTAAPTGAQLEPSPLARDGWLRLTVRAAFYVVLFVFAGGAATAALLPTPRPAGWLVGGEAGRALANVGRDPDAVAARAWRRTVRAGWLSVVAATGVALVEAADAAGGLSAAGAVDFLLTNVSGLARIGAVVVLALGAAAAAAGRVRSAAKLATLALLAVALSGHANSAEPRAAAVLTDVVHLLAGAVWIGGIVQIAAIWLPAGGERRAALHSVLPRFGRVALPAFLVVTATGLTNALIQLGHPDALWQTSYGRVLAVKIALVGLIAAASWSHALRLRPRLLVANPHPAARLERRHWRLLGAEPWLALAVLVVAAVLAAFPVPPSELGERAAAAVRPCAPYCPFAKPAPGELTVAAPAGPHTVAAWLRKDGRALRGTVRAIDRRRRPARVALRVRWAAWQRSCGAGCRRFRLMSARARLEVSLSADARSYRVSLPARWLPERGNARRLLARAQAAMRRLRSHRQRELVQSIPTQALSSPPRSVTELRFRSPDRMAYRTSSVESIVVAGRQWLRADGAPWQRQPSTGTQAYLPRNRFRWTLFGASARMLAVRGSGSRPIAELAFLDHGYPVWYRLRVELASGRALSATLTTPDNRIRDRYYAFNRPVSIRPPRAVP
jgi:copper transport protein